MSGIVTQARRGDYTSTLVLPPGARAAHAMSTPYIGEIRLMGSNFPPAGWALCDGQVVPISENDVLFNLIGTIYGGDGQNTFALPNLQGRIPVHMGQGPGLAYNRTIGETGGAEMVTLTAQQVPSHTHPILASSSPGYQASPANAVPARHRDHQAFSTNAPGAPALGASVLQPAGGSQPHDNMPPYLAINFSISLFGIYPSQT